MGLQARHVRLGVLLALVEKIGLKLQNRVFVRRLGSKDVTSRIRLPPSLLELLIQRKLGRWFPCQPTDPKFLEIEARLKKAQTCQPGQGYALMSLPTERQSKSQPVRTFVRRNTLGMRRRGPVRRNGFASLSRKGTQVSKLSKSRCLANHCCFASFRHFS